MADLIDVVELRPILELAGINMSEPNLEVIYQEIATAPDHQDTAAQIESTIREYFERIKIPENANFYDYLLLSLRDKDLVATFNWDPLLLQAYRRNAWVRHLPKILFLHGNVAIGLCLDCRIVGPIGMKCENCGHELEPSRLLYPIQDKDYVSDPFIEGEWDALKRYLTEAYILTIVGYSAPDADTAAIDMMMQVWDENQARELAQIEIVNTQPKEQLVEAWSPFFVRDHYHITKTIHRTLQARYPRRSCDAFGSASLLVTPWAINQMPELPDLRSLQAWFRPLVREEIALKEEGRPFSGMPTQEIEI